MGLDTYFYRCEDREFVNPKTKEKITYLRSSEHELAYFRKNYCLMEWFDKHWEMEVENCVDYLVDKDDIDALLKDCHFAIDLVDEACNYKELEHYGEIRCLSDEVQSRLKKLFPMNSWRAGRRWNQKTQSYVEYERKFDGGDYEDLKEIIEQLSEIDWEYTKHIIFHNCW